MSFTPIALVGHGCVLPGALSPTALWEAVADGRDLTSGPPPGAWPADPRDIIGGDGECFRSNSRPVPSRGGFVTGFDEIFEPDSFLLEKDDVAALDRSVKWLFEASKQAIRGAGLDDLTGRKSAVVVGNNAYPSASLVEMVNRTLIEEPLGLAELPPRDTDEGRRYWANRYSSGRPAHVLAKGVGANGPAFCLDAACASSLYAVKLACDYLQDGTVDVALAGAVSGTDNIFLHLGFSEIKALSPTGMSRPFSRHADGLLPAEGAAALLFKRLDDAVREGDRILAVVRGVGLSNDGRRGGLLAPDKDGQVTALERAYKAAGVDPSTVSLLECHATGTPTGDRIELASAGAIFTDSVDLPVGSLKSNLGHLITAAGAGAIIKVVEAMAHETRPPTVNADEPLAEFDGTPLRPLRASEPWPNGAVRVAGISNFGFGGSNAHLILEQFAADARSYPVVNPLGNDPVVVCGLGLIVGGAVGLDAFTKSLFDRGTQDTDDLITTVETPFAGIKFPPSDLQNSLGQQTAVLAACREAVDGVVPVDADRCGVIIGMGCDIDAVRPGLRYRLSRTLDRLGASLSEDEKEDLAAAIGGLMGQDYVMGCMPNLPANRLNAQFDWRGLGYTVASEELSGCAAIDIAARALKVGELDMAVAGAVDFTHTPVDSLAAEAVFPATAQKAGDATVIFVLKRKHDAETAGDPILATLGIKPAGMQQDGAAETGTTVGDLGHTHAAKGVVQAAEALATATARVAIDGDNTQLRALAEPLSVPAASFTGQSQTLSFDNIAAKPGYGVKPDAPHIFFTAAADLRDLTAALKTRTLATEGQLRLAIVAQRREELDRKIANVVRLIDDGRPIDGPGISFGAGGVNGELAFVYPGLGGAYAGMENGLGVAFPEIIGSIEAKNREWIARTRQYDGAAIAREDFVAEAGTVALLATLNTHILRDHLGVTPRAALGVSMGEVNMLVANGIWQRPEAVLTEMAAEGFYEKLAIGHEAIARSLNLPPGEPVRWENYDVFAPVDVVEAAVDAVPRVWVTIVASPHHCMIGGLANECAAVLRTLPAGSAVRSGTDMAFHGEFAAEVGEMYRRTHTQPVTPSKDLRLYFNAAHDVVEQNSEQIAKCLRDQGINRVDFRPTVEKAWNDGVRIFVDIGPRAGLTAAIRSTLGDRPHIAVSLDSRNRDGLLQLADAAGALYAAAVPIDLAGLAARMARLRGDENATGAARETRKMLSLRAKLPPVQRKALERFRKGGSKISFCNEDPSDLAVMPPPPDLAVRIATPPNRPAAVQAPTEVVMTPPPTDPPPALRTIRAAAPKGATLPSSKEIAGQLPTGDTTKPSQFDASSIPVKPIEVLPPEGPRFDRKQLEVLASGKISSVFGPLFEQQDGYARQCRMPEPPLLLADRVLGMVGEPGAMGKGVCWTETDIGEDAWYLSDRSMPTGLLIEAGQADLLLISWLGADFLNRDERVYRLLGCEITFHDGPSPTVGDTVRFQIHIDGHAKLGDTRMFFFSYDARIGDRLVSSVRSGQAGFFSDSELANSGGVLWAAEEDAPKADARVDAIPGATVKRAFSFDDVRAFAEGDAYACFGEGFEPAAAHQRTPGIPTGRMQLIERVTAFDPNGGPWGRGYLKAECDVPTDAWFYDGHFKNDPCMPGTLMAEAATQAMVFHMAALGFTIARDGWRFRPVTDEAFKFVCRGQVIPDTAHKVTYEVFVEEILDGDEPTVYAALLASSDGHKVFLCRRFGLKLVRDWPLYQRDVYLEDSSERRIVSPTGDVPGDYKALLACAWGKPSDAFGSMYKRFDSESCVPLLPGPPYLLMSRVISVDCPPGKATTGGKVVVEFDVDPAAWYFDVGGNGVMPFSVLTEILLQPCGWFASYMGFALAGDLKLRNLDASEVCAEREVTRDAGTLTIEATFTQSSAVGPMSIVFYEVVCRSTEGVVLTLKTDFGLFSADALARQKGLPIAEAQRAALATPSAVGSETLQSPLADVGRPTGRLAVVDSITGFWPDGGKAGLGRATGRQTVDPSSWYFKAHFFTDPVQPGSLGLEALFSLFKAAVNLRGLAARFSDPRFEAPAVGTTLGWKYRGQVIPTNKEVTTEIDIVEIVDEGDTILVRAEGSLWVDGLRIYEVSGYALRIHEMAPEQHRRQSPTEVTTPVRAPVDLTAWSVDADVDPWLNDHCPTYCLPVYPLMGVVADLLSGDGRDAVRALADVELGSWIRLDQGPVTLSSNTFAMPDGRVSRQLYRRDADRDRRIGRAIEIEAAAFPAPPPAWTGVAAEGVPGDPYATGELFHFELINLARDFLRTDRDSRFVFDAGEAFRRASGHFGLLLDVVIHGVPHSRPELWFGSTAKHMAAFPYRIESLRLYSNLPREGELEVLTRAVGRPSPRTVKSEIQVVCDRVVVLDVSLIEAFVSTRMYERLPPHRREAFGRRKQFVEGWSIAAVTEAETTLAIDTMRQANWLPGTLETLYGLPADGSLDEKTLTEQVAIKDHFAVRNRLHPSAVDVKGDTVIPRGAPPVMLSEVDRAWVSELRFEIRDRKANAEV